MGTADICKELRVKGYTAVASYDEDSNAVIRVRKGTLGTTIEAVINITLEEGDVKYDVKFVQYDIDCTDDEAKEPHHWEELNLESMAKKGDIPLDMKKDILQALI